MTRGPTSCGARALACRKRGCGCARAARQGAVRGARCGFGRLFVAGRGVEHGRVDLQRLLQHARHVAHGDAGPLLRVFLRAAVALFVRAHGVGQQAQALHGAEQLLAGRVDLRPALHVVLRERALAVLRIRAGELRVPLGHVGVAPRLLVAHLPRGREVLLRLQPGGPRLHEVPAQRVDLLLQFRAALGRVQLRRDPLPLLLRGGLGHAPRQGPQIPPREAQGLLLLQHRRAEGLENPQIVLHRAAAQPGRLAESGPVAHAHRPFRPLHHGVAVELARLDQRQPPQQGHAVGLRIEAEGADGPHGLGQLQMARHLFLAQGQPARAQRLQQGRVLRRLRLGAGQLPGQFPPPRRRVRGPAPARFLRFRQFRHRRPS